MIIRRYLSLQVLGSTASVALVLTVILMSGRVIKYFGMAADGRMDVKLLTAVLLYRLPGFLELIVPLGMFIAILLVFGRLYLDNEMTVMSASGISRGQRNSIPRMVQALVPVKTEPGGYTLCTGRFWRGCRGSSSNSFHLPCCQNAGQSLPGV